MGKERKLVGFCWPIFGAEGRDCTFHLCESFPSWPAQRISYLRDPPESITPLQQGLG